MKTEAFVVDSQGGDFRLTEVELDDPRDDEVLVRVVATGLCHSDLTVKDYLPAEWFPRVFGHEGAGVVEKVGASVEGIDVGDQVVLSYRSCRACAACEAGHVSYCDQHLLLNHLGMRADGSQTVHLDGAPIFGSFFGQSSFARHALATADNCVVVDPEADLTLLAPFGCGFQTGAGTVLNVLDPLPSKDSLVVFGVGSVGLAAVAAGRAAGFETVVAVDTTDSRLEVATGWGAVAVNPGSLAEGESVVERVKQLTGGGASAAIDTTGIPEVVTQAQLATRAMGTIVAIGLGAEQYTVDALDLLQSGKVFRSSVEGDSDPLTFIPRLIAMRDAGDLPFDSLVTTYPATDIERAIADVTSGRVVKPVLVW
ncbi:NAD(P)-dependent alcohol dehydrogenase [Nocardioides acrostichi]|uniref:NAD(P)-dependent alcohol dehydrogenase n=1 Tax=Nocardioides acrostichi TaxID=2784339 RepID=A0A930UWG0_9ACTN|nr:NAD(P)-dependent alcohol dehydrogenase [Nocardioides acrostichi]MBF4161411.1 NAD(P)-dependent alcohol dehydrogenase [Nocardioides acrostichi]